MTAAAMTHVERFRAVMNFQPVDRLPRIEWAMWWPETIRRWQREGLPIRREYDHATVRYDLYRHFGLDVYRQHRYAPGLGNLPPPTHHGAGRIEDADDYRRARRHLFPPVEAMEATWDRLAGWQEAQESDEGLIWVSVPGFFGFPRSLLGIERHLYAFYDQPALMHRINRELAQWNVAILRRTAEVCSPVFATVREDMSYNHGPMLSKECFEQFLAPYYRRLTPIMRELDITVFVDSDGDVTEMVPWLRAVGVQGALPLERQAGVDAPTIRETDPGFLMIGHFDKMTMTRGTAAMREEFERLRPVTTAGGYIPSVDHQTPPGVSLRQYHDYLDLLREFSRGAAPA